MPLVTGWAPVRRRVLASATACAICGGPLDFDAPPRSRWAPSVDHVLPRHAARHLDAATQRRLALDPANLRPAHYGCNSRRKAGQTALPRRTSRQWQ